MSGFEIITITFSFILGLGVTLILRSIRYAVRERDEIGLHWIPLSVAVIILAHTNCAQNWRCAGNQYHVRTQKNRD